MKCENFLCVYENKGQCLLERVELDVVGLCKECVYIDIEDEALAIKKEQMRNKLNSD